MIKVSVVGGLLVAVTVLMHAYGTTLWVRHLKHRSDSIEASYSVGAIVLLLINTALVILGLHLLEVTAWAVTYLAMLGDQTPWSFEQAMYFSLVTFTTLGYGDITLGQDWRVLSGIEALNGILLVGWSTALLFSVLQRIWQSPHIGPD